MQYPPSSPPTLLPPFDPVSSPIQEEFPKKIQFTAAAFAPYATPAPTSSPRPSGRGYEEEIDIKSGYSPSSPKEFDIRSPLADVILANVHKSGAPITIGRSSQSSTYAVSCKNRLVSRVHVSIHYDTELKKICFKCVGWNGCMVYSPNETGQDEFWLSKGETIEMEEKEGISVDIRGERVVLNIIDDHDTDLEISPIKALESESDITPESKFVLIKESSSVSLKRTRENTEDYTSTFKRVRTSESSQETIQELDYVNELSPPYTSDPVEPIHEYETPPQDENNEPIESKSLLDLPEVKQAIQNNIIKVSPKKSVQDFAFPEDHTLHLIIDHLAFSRLSSTPLSLLQKAIPLHMHSHLASILKSLPSSIGVIQRKGKDAAGKPLEEEYYYIAENDDDEDRKQTVEQLRGTTLTIRSCRKNHKQYFWRKPAKRSRKTPN